MDDPEQYVMRVLHRTRTGLQDSLIPNHAEKMQRLADRLEQASNLKDEIARLQHVNGFTKAALSMQWLVERVQRSGEDFTPDQFDSDATLLSDKFFEAFLSEPFDGPGEPPPPAPTAAEKEDQVAPVPESAPSEPPVSPAESVGEIPVTAAEEPVHEEPAPAPFVPEPPVSTPEQVSEMPPTAAEEPVHEEPAPPPPPPVVEPPALVDLLDQNLLLGFQRFTEIVSKLGEKTPAERKSVFAVLAMIARSSTDVARAQGKKDVLEFFQSVMKFIAYVDSSGSAQDSRVAQIMKDVGERLSKALKERSDGAALLQSINEILKNPESSLKS